MGESPVSERPTEFSGWTAAMTPTTEETVGGSGGDGDGLRESAQNASTQFVLGDIMAWKRSGPAVVEQRKCLPISRSVINSSERPMVPTYVGIGRRPSGTPKEPRSEIPDKGWTLEAEWHKLSVRPEGDTLTVE